MSESLPDNPIKGVTKKVGPLPLYAYAVIIVGVAYGIYWYKNRVGTARPVGITEVGTGMSSAGPAPGTGTYDGATGGNKATPAAQTNAQWAKKVADGMIATGTPPADANNAVAAYLAGQSLTPVQQAVITIALQIYGNPPEGVVAVKGPGNFLSYMLDKLTGKIYGIGADGSRTWLTPEQYATLGKPPVTSTTEDTYSKIISDGNKIYGVTNTGTRVWLSASQYAALGSPPIQEYFTGDATYQPWDIGATKYVVKEGDTLSSIAMAHYGSSDTSRLSAANPGVVLTAGTVITIP